MHGPGPTCIACFFFRYIPEAVEAVDNTERFELAGPEEAQKDVVYGLIKREQVDRPAGPSVTSREWEDQRFKEDVEALPDEVRHLLLQTLHAGIESWTDGCVGFEDDQGNVGDREEAGETYFGVS